MRTIGKKNKKIVTEMVKKVLAENKHNPNFDIMESVKNKLPASIYASIYNWENADSEIERIIIDVIFSEQK